MRARLILLALGIGACAEQSSERHDPAAPSSNAPRLTSGEERLHIAPRGEPAATLRSGPEVPISLPKGLSLYPGATVVSNTVVSRAGRRRVLLVFETADEVAKVITHYRAEARAAGLAVGLDLGGSDRASFGGTLPSGAEFALSLRREGTMTRVELAHS